jgi:3-dehydroquinate synthase class II
VNELAGAVVWAVVPFVPQAPFRLYAGPRHAPVEVAQADKLIAAARRGADTEFTFLAPGKARPVLVVSDRIDPRLSELLALRLVRLSTLDAREQVAVRAGTEPGLFHLPPERFELPEENAAIIAALVRVHETAIDPSPVGRLDGDEVRAVHERIARHYGLDLHALVRAELQRLADAQRRRSD